MSQNKENDGRQKGPQQHAEGQHGEKTHQRFLEQLAGSNDELDPMLDPQRKLNDDGDESERDRQRR